MERGRAGEIERGKKSGRDRGIKGKIDVDRDEGKDIYR